jgi:nucleolar protein 4
LPRGKKNAEKAIETVNGKIVDGRLLAVDCSVEKETWEKLQSEGQHADDGGSVPSEGNTYDNDSKKTLPTESNQLERTSEIVDGEGVTSSESEKHNANGTDNEDEDMEDIGPEDDGAEEIPSTTAFIRNLHFKSTEETLHAQFLQFGAVRYPRVVFDPETERSRGTGFVCSFNEDDAKSCVSKSPKPQAPPSNIGD